MRKKGICFGLILALLLPFVFTTEVKASDNTELNIYAFYLNSEKKGDSTLLESKGHYLLIDIGADNHAPAIIKQLQTLGVTHVDVMFSHLHTDHTGGCSTDLQAGLKQFALSGITIDTLYLPDPSLAVLSRSYPSRYAAFQAFMSTQGTGRIVYLNVGDQVNVGDATGKVIGPVNTNEISPYAYTSITKEKERFIKEAKAYQKEALSIAKISSLLNPFTSVITNIAIIAIIYFGSKMVNRGNLLQGEVIALVNYMNQILLALIVVSNLVVIFTKAYASLKRCDALLSLNSSIKNGEDTDIDFDNENIIEFKNVSFAYDDITETSIHDIDFSVKKGSTIGIIGGTGSGKSTLIKLIERFYDPSLGKIYLSGKDLQEYDLKILRKTIGLVHQKAVLFKGTIRTNLQMANSNASDDEMIAALRVAKALDFVMEKGGLDAWVEENGRNYSGGQKQRITIAQAIVKKPNILILDDSTSALDYMTDAAVRKNIKNYSKDLTTIIISQRASSLKDADKIIVLDDGKIEGIGTHNDLLRDCMVYQEICSSQKEVGGE